MDVIYANLLALLSTKIPDLNWIDLDQGQIDFPADHYPISYPACLIDFEDTEWEDIGQGMQGGTATISFRIAFRIYQDSNNHTQADSRKAGLDKLKLINTIHATLHGYAGTNYNALTRTRQFTEKRQDGLKVVAMQYSTYIKDSSAMITYKNQLVQNLEVQKG